MFYLLRNLKLKLFLIINQAVIIGYYIIGQNTRKKRQYALILTSNYTYQIVKKYEFNFIETQSNFQITTNLTQFKRIKTRLTKTHKNELVSDKNIEWQHLKK